MKRPTSGALAPTRPGQRVPPIAVLAADERGQTQSPDIFERLDSVAAELDAHWIRDETAALRERESDGRFYVACVGQFKRGKSTLLNALIGARLLPTGVVPVTSVPTIVRYGPVQAARARLANSGGQWIELDPADLREFVSEEHNPENVKGVIAVELFTPSALLECGMCLVDTPGLGSVFAGNTTATHEFVPHIDAALAVVGADPPISGDELDLIEGIARHSAHLIVVLNKADRVGDAEREEAMAFTTQVLTRRLRASSPSIAEARVFAVSALEQLDGRGSKRDWEALLFSLRELSESSGRAIVRASIDRGIARMTASLLVLIDEELLALTQPFEESERRLIDLRKRAAAAEQSLGDLGPLMAAEETRVSRVFQDRRRRFLEEAAPPASRGLQERLSALGVSSARMRRTSFIGAQDVARETIEPFLVDSEVVANEVYISAASRFVALANEATRDVGAAHAATASDLEDLPARFVEGARLRGRRQFHFHSYEQLAAPAGLGPAVRGVLNAIAPRAFVVRRTERAAHAFLAKLLDTNTSRVEGNVMARVVESRRLLESEIRGALARAVAMAGTALERARTAHADGRDSVTASIARLEQLRSMLTTLDVPHVRRNAEDGED